MSKSQSVTESASSQLSKRQLALYCQIAAWSISLIVTALAVVVWGQSNAWHVFPVNSYQLFPVLGLVAFSLMWGHYAAGFMRQIMRLERPVLKRYFDATSWAVLVLICLHPGILIYQLFRDGAGLPPHSYEHYVAPGLGWVTLLGSVCLLVFLAYEFRRKFGKRPWWRYMQFATDAAMLGIFYHALRLGDQLRHGWYRGVWWFYGISLIIILAYTYQQKLAGRSVSDTVQNQAKSPV